MLSCGRALLLIAGAPSAAVSQWQPVNLPVSMPTAPYDLELYERVPCGDGGDRGDGECRVVSVFWKIHEWLQLTLRVFHDDDDAWAAAATLRCHCIEQVRPSTGAAAPTGAMLERLEYSLAVLCPEAAKPGLRSCSP